LEMFKESLLQRLVASVAQIDAHKFRTGHLNREDWRRMTEALGTISSSPLWVDDSGSISVLEIGAKARRLKRDKGMSVLIVDYLQLITARGRFGNRQEEVASISRGLKGLAKELRIPVLVLSQLTRAPERDERGPQLSDLRESGAIEQDADVVMFIYRPHFFKQGATPEEREETELKIAKQRNGPVDSVNFVFRSRFTRFEEAAPDAFSHRFLHQSFGTALASLESTLIRNRGEGAAENQFLPGLETPRLYGLHGKSDAVRLWRCIPGKVGEQACRRPSE